MQSGEIAKPDVDEEWSHRPRRADRRGDGPDRATQGRPGPLPVILYIHGAGWVFGNATPTTGWSASSPSAPAPRSCSRTTASRRRRDTRSRSSRTTRCAVGRERRGGAGPGRRPDRGRRRLRRRQHDRRADPDGQGARRRPDFVAQVLFYPVTDANFDTGSYHQFAEGYFLRRDAMQWFWDQYTTGRGRARRDHRVAAAATRAARRAAAGAGHHRRGRRAARRGRGLRRQAARGRRRVTAVRYQGIIHDFVMLNALREHERRRRRDRAGDRVHQARAGLTDRAGEVPIRGPRRS